MKRRLLKAYLLKESPERLRFYRYEGAMLRYLQKWIDQLRWQRLHPEEKPARMLPDHLDGILNDCRTKAPLGVVRALYGNIKALLRRGRGNKNLRYPLLKAQRLAATRTQFLALQKAVNGAGVQIFAHRCKTMAHTLLYTPGHAQIFLAMT